MLGIPAPTQLDLNFRLFGIPIRISPFFWLLAAIIGLRYGSGLDRPEDSAVVASCVLVSVLVHELGHGLTARCCGDRPWIVLHGFGGACVSNREAQPFGRRLMIILMGPVAGLLLAIATVSTWAALVAYEIRLPPQAELAMNALLVLNLIYSAFNLIPVWPLDGGQLLLTMLDRLSPRHGARRAHILSFLASGSAAALALAWGGAGNWLLVSLWLGYFAFINFVLLSHYHRIAMAEREGW
ncbi:metalloprotease [Tautonia sociabilis]|uniref:Peptidase M50 domain-containing protein n=1 Tax=Tautonia sociabilis TaxID=2080755 RepID=A0A432MMC2_9BACT|nr:site-2 protease family protein [Tautonia sociabilis]RUL88266.1 hypothetical protein TsocGM_07985 [Tautonia sociabilis]